MLSRLVPSLLMALPLLLGCGKTAPPPADRLAIEGIAQWHERYVLAHGRKPPADEAAFLGFIEATVKDRGQKFDPATFLVSPRDGQKYVILYGKESANVGDNEYVVREKEGYDGKVLVADQSGRSSEVNVADLPPLTAAKP